MTLILSLNLYVCLLKVKGLDAVTNGKLLKRNQEET